MVTQYIVTTPLGVAGSSHFKMAEVLVILVTDILRGGPEGTAGGGAHSNRTPFNPSQAPLTTLSGGDIDSVADCIGQSLHLDPHRVPSEGLQAGHLVRRGVAGESGGGDQQLPAGLL